MRRFYVPDLPPQSPPYIMYGQVWTWNTCKKTANARIVSVQHCTNWLEEGSLHFFQNTMSNFLKLLLFISFCAGTNALVGGNKANLKKYPFFVKIHVKYITAERRPIYEYRICGGSLVGKNAVLTAAHCLQPPSIKDSNLVDWFLKKYLLNVQL